jgi:hypothetical protein
VGVSFLRFRLDRYVYSVVLKEMQAWEPGMCPQWSNLLW